MSAAYVKLVTLLNQATDSGKVLDVSGINPDATGIRVVNMPKTARSSKKHIRDLAVYSNNYNSYRAAMEILGPEFLSYADEFRAEYGAAASPKAAAGNAAKIFIEAYNDAVTKGQVLDVSELAADGTGARKRKVPKTMKGTHRWVPEFPYVTSDNYAAYHMAMRLLGPEYEQHADEFLRLYGAQKYAREAKPAFKAPRIAAKPAKVAYTVPSPLSPRGTAPRAQSPKALRPGVTVPTVLAPKARSPPRAASPPQRAVSPPTRVVTPPRSPPRVVVPTRVVPAARSPTRIAVPGRTQQ